MEKNATVHCSVFTRPIRSESMPATQPPSAEATRVTPLTIPACVRLIDHSAMIAGITRLNNCTSSESSAHPPKHAQNVRRSLPDTSLNHLNIAVSCVVYPIVGIESFWIARSFDV